MTVASAEELADGVSGDALRSVARSHGYHLLKNTPDGQLKFVRNPWGYFGNLLLHVGITVVIVLSLYAALTARQAALILVEGQEHRSGAPWTQSQYGVYAKPLVLPGTIRLDRVAIRYDAKQQPLEVSSELSITDADGAVEKVSAAINRILTYRGLRIYHAAQYGNAFDVTFTGRDGVVHRETVAAHHPLSPSEPGYSDEFGVAWATQLLSAKYYTDAARRTADDGNPELVLRMTEQGRETGRVTLGKGASGMLGEFRVQLVGVSRWAKLMVVDGHGISLIFSGFAIIMLGGLLQYLLPPRELIAFIHPHGRYTVFWRAPLFRSFYLDEQRCLAAELRKGDIV
jgi:cytochrome c biogenesis protein ResB